MPQTGARKPELEYRFYNIDSGHFFLPKVGDGWEQEYGKGLNGQLHFHNLMEIGYCFHGSGTVVIGDKKERYSDDFFTIIPKHIPHTTMSDPGHKCLWNYLFIDFENFCQSSIKDGGTFSAEEIIDAVSKNGVISSKEENPGIAEHIQDMLFECTKKQKYYEDILMYEFLSVLVELLRHTEENALLIKKNKREQYLTPALDYIDKNFAENIKIKDLADLCALSESHFRRTFEEIMEMKPLDYVNFVRIRKACDLIRKTSMSMQDISLEIGYDTISTFNRNFRKLTGTTPYKWKEAPGNKDLDLSDFHISAKKGWEANGVTPK